MKNADMPAMPTYELNGQNVLEDTSYGLTKREMFAMHAMQGICNNGSESWLVNHAPAIAVKISDALLAELEKTNDQ